MPAPTSLSVGGFVPLSTVDWPDQLAAVVFARGCPWNCPYCHNPHLIPGTPATSDVPWDEVRSFLLARRGLLDGVVFSGGEPTAQVALFDAVAEVRDMGFSVAIHTGGPHMERFARLLDSIDWVGFDVKAPFERYDEITRVAGSGERALESLRALVASGVPFEARTTVHGDMLGAQDLVALADQLRELGVRDWVIQPWRSDGSALSAPARAFLVDDIPASVREGFASFSVR